MPARLFRAPDVQRSGGVSPEADAIDAAARPAVVPPISVQRGVRGLNRWDLPAALLVLGLLVFFAEASRGLTQPLANLETPPLSLDPVNLP